MRLMSFAHFLIESGVSMDGTLVGGIKRLQAELEKELGGLSRFDGPAGYQKLQTSAGPAIGITYFRHDADQTIQLVYGNNRRLGHSSIIGIRVWNGAWIEGSTGEPRQADHTVDPGEWDLLDKEQIAVVGKAIAAAAANGTIGKVQVLIPEGYLRENMQNTSDFRMLYDLYCQDKGVDEADVVDFNEFKAIVNNHGFNCPAQFNPVKNPAARVSRAKVSLLKVLESAAIVSAKGNGALGAVVDIGYKSMVASWRTAGLSAEQIVKDLDDDLRGLVKVVATGNTNSLVVAGRGGVGKTFSIEDELGHENAGKTWISLAGKTSTYKLFETFFLNRKRGKIVVLDDINAFDAESANLLKAALDSKPKRVITWSSKATVPMPKDFEGTQSDWLDSMEEAYWEAVSDGPGALAKFKLPNQVLFEAAVIFITNVPMSKLYDDPHLGAVCSRSLKLDYDLNDEEVLTKIEMMSKHIRKDDISEDVKNEVLEVLRTNLKKGLLTDLSMRQFINGIGIASSGLSKERWKRLLGYS